MATVQPSDVRDIAAVVQDLVWSLRRFGERAAGLEPLPHSEFEVIHTVAERPGIAVSEVARALALQPSNVSTTVRRLVERGLVERAADPDDRRSTRLRLTPVAAEHKKLIDAVWTDGVRAELSRMSGEEIALAVAAAPLFRRLAGMSA